MDTNVARYLNDHLAGSSGALLLITELGERHPDPAARAFFAALHAQCLKDRGTVEELLCTLGHSESKVTQMAAGVAARIGGIKLLWEKMGAGHLGLFEALEVLTLGIQGKKLLWAVCHEVSPMFPEWNHYDFAGLEMQAIEQRDAVEQWRKKAVAAMIPQDARMSA